MTGTEKILAAKILVVDDQPANVLLLERMLKDAGYTDVTSTTDPRDVCLLHNRNRYDIILLDLQMPHMDGFQVMEALKGVEADPYLPVLVITAQPGHNLRALHAGARDFISKPFELAEVLLRVHNMLEVRLLHMETRRLYEALVAEKQQSLLLAAMPGAMVGIEKNERLGTHWFRSLVLRHPWLLLNLFTAFVAAAVVGCFQETINRLLILTIFLPVLVSQSSNTGSQALAITLRGMTLGELESGMEKQLVWKESLLGLLNGLLIGLVAAIGMYVVAVMKHLPDAFMLSVVVFAAMIGSCVISGICGAVVPLLLRRLGADPVVASSIFLTTATDVVSMGMLLGLATVLV
ncbi:MAG TPA: response regulator [Pseudomonadales bacterium]|nr:response regulator [Pseudomonadales bacterium]